MFKFYRNENERYEDVFILNNKIIKGLIKKNLLKMSDLDNYKLPSSMEDIIPMIEKLSGSAKLLTDVIAQTLNVESFLKINRVQINKDTVIGQDYIIVNNVFFTTNPLSGYIQQLKANIKKYNTEEVLFNKIGYISSLDFEVVKEEIIKKSKNTQSAVLSNLYIETVLLNSVNESIDKNASNLRIFYRNNEIRTLQTINNLTLEKVLIKTSISNYNRFSEYLISNFENNLRIKEYNSNRYKIKLSTSIANEDMQEVAVIDLKLSNLKANIENIPDTVNLEMKESRELKRALNTAFGLFVVSSKSYRKENIYSIAKREEILHKNARIMLFEKDIEIEFDNITQSDKYQKVEDWKTMDFSNYNVVIFEEIKNEEEFIFALELTTRGKKVIIGMNSNSSIETFSKIYKLTENKELLSDNLLGIFHAEKINEVCPSCSLPTTLFKDENYQDFSMLEKLPKMTTVIKKESHKGCELCYKGYVGLINVAEYLHNDNILKYAILEEFNLSNFRIEKNSDSWMNIYENSLYLLEENKITTNSIIKNLGYPKK